jgi:hypothetical protein
LKCQQKLIRQHIAAFQNAWNTNHDSLVTYPVAQSLYQLS